MTINFPENRILCKAEKFEEALYEVLKVLGCKEIEYTKLGMCKFYFDDGSNVSASRALMDKGLITYK